MLAGRRVPAPASGHRSRSSRHARRDRGVAISTASRYVDAERASGRGRRAPTSRCPFGGVPVGDQGARAGRGLALHRGVARLPATASPPTRAPSSSGCSSAAARCRSGQTTASEFGGLNVSVTKLNGVTHNPWRHGRTVGGSSGGSARRGRRRARQPRDRRRRRRLDPHPRRLHRAARHEGHLRPHPARPARVHAARTPSCSATSPRSVRDAARYFDVCARLRPARPVEPARSTGGWEAGLGTHDLRGQAGRRSSRTSAASRSSRASRTASAPRPAALIADTGMVRGRPRRRRCRTSPRSG